MEFLSNSIPILGSIPSNTFDPHDILCRIDTIAPLFFVIGVISALLSHGGYEFIGGMATRGKTRPSVPTSTTANATTTATATSPTSSNSSSSMNSTVMNSSVSPPKRQSPLSSSIKTAPSSSSSSSRLNPSSTAATGSHHDWFKSFLYGDQWSVKKSFFLHYYIAGTISLLFLGMVWWWDGHDHSRTLPSPATMALYLLCLTHCIRRSYECYYIHLFSPTARMHILFYIIAVLYYVFIPAMLFDLPIVCHDTSTTTSSGGGDCESSSGCYRWKYYSYVTSTQSQVPVSSSISSVSIAFIVTATCFGLWAQYQQYHHHCILANLRRTKTTTNGAASNGYESNGGHSSTPSSSSPSNTNGSSHVSMEKHSYKIPMGGWFTFVTCPHYFAEVLLYISYGILIAIDNRLPNLQRFVAFYYSQMVHPTADNDVSLFYLLFVLIWEYRFIILFLFVVLNLQFAALDNHNWYCMKFENYSKLHRKTMFPFVY